MKTFSYCIANNDEIRGLQNKQVALCIELCSASSGAARYSYLPYSFNIYKDDHTCTSMQDAKYLYVKKRPLSSDLKFHCHQLHVIHSIFLSVDQHGILLSMTLVRIVNVLVYKPPKPTDCVSTMDIRVLLPYLYLDILLYIAYTYLEHPKYVTYNLLLHIVRI